MVRKGNGEDVNEEPMPVGIHEGEILEDLQRNGLKIIQKRRGFRFCTDSVLLADFCAANPGERVADMGTGSGVIPLLIAARTDSVRIHGFELQTDLADMAQRSVRLNGLEERISIHNCDARQAAGQIGYGQTDLVVTNPPYLQKGDGLVSPDEHSAIARGGSGCPIEEWMQACSKLMRNGGRICTVFPSAQLMRLCDAMRAAGLEPKRLRLVLARPDKEAKLILLEGRKQGRPGLRILPPLITHDGEGGFSPEMRRIYGENSGGPEEHLFPASGSCYNERESKGNGADKPQ